VNGYFIPVGIEVFDKNALPFPHKINTGNTKNKK
jgi:hypothetical protein